MDFYSKVEPYGQEYHDLKMSWIDKEQERLADFYKDDVAAAKWAAKEKMKVSSETFYRENEDRQQAFAGMASSLNQMAQLYEEDSKARQALSAASKVATMAEIALQVQKNIMIAIGAVVTQGTGDPYSAFARIAAMIAVVAGVLSIGGIAFSMGAGGGGGGKSAPVLPASTVLGAEAGTGSDSVAKSLKLLEDTYKMEYRELKELNDSMKDLNRNITGLVTSIVRTGGVTAGTFNVPGNKQSPAETAWLKFNDFVGQFIPDLPMLGDFSKKIFNWFEGLVGDILSGIFGGEKSVKVKAAGIKLGEITINDLLAGVDIAGQQYADIKEKISGGIFGSDKTKYYTLYKALDEDINALFTSVFSDMSRTLVALAGSFGADVEETLAYMFPEVKINLKGMNAEEINKAISEAISKAGDIAVEALFGAIVKGYQQVGEGLLETAIRLAQDKAVITEMLAMTNQSFTGTVPEVIAFSEALIEMSGGLDKLTSAAQKYYDSFFSDAEQQARTYKQMTDILADMNMTLPATRDGFRDLVESLDLTTTSGQEAYITLMQLSESAAAYYDYLAELQKKAFDFVFDLQTKIDSLTGSSRAIGMMWGRMTEIYYQINTAAGSAADRLEALKEGIALLDQWVAANIAAIEDFYRIRKEAIQMQIENINKQIERLNEQKTVISEQISAIQKQIDLTKTWKSVLESVEKQILDMKTSTDSPKDIFERMDVMKSEMERVRDLYEGATGEEKAGYAADLQRLIQEYLGMAQEAYQRPSPEYQQIYDEMLRWLEGIRTDAVAGSASETDLLAQIIDLEEQSKAIDEQIKVYQEQIKDLNVQMAALDTQMAADIQAFKEEAAGYYQWAMEEGAKLYDDQLSELGLLLESNEEGNQILIHIHDVLNGISKGLGIPVPALAEGGYVTKPTLALLGEAGPEAVIPLSKMGSGQQYHTMSINISLPPITINAGEKTSPQGTARATEDIIVRSLKSGRIRKVVQEVFAGR